MTTEPFYIVVADDGSTDETEKFCRYSGITMIGGVNRGISWNKNRALYALFEYTDAENIFLIEDDCYATERGWQEVWIAAVQKWGHINLVHPTTAESLAAGIMPEEIIGGSGTAEDPYACMRISGLCIASSRTAMRQVGYFDTRFQGYGHEHAEWTTRYRRSGFGIYRVKSPQGDIKANTMLSRGLGSLNVPSQSNKASRDANKEIFNALKNQEIYRYTWRSELDRAVLVSEVESALGIYTVDVRAVNQDLKRLASQSELSPREWIAGAVADQLALRR
jgi:glycosyltransferase involved in cell wall biosynthesis